MTPVFPRRRRPGFTLLEVMAVVLLLSLLAAVALPALGRSQAGAAEEDAREVAAAIEYARRSALATRQDHRLILDLREARWWVERRERPRDPESDLAPGEITIWGNQSDLPLTAPRTTLGEYQPVSGLVGQGNVLRDDVFFGGAETATGWIDDGQLQIEVRADGQIDAVEIHLVTAERDRIRIAIAALDEHVGIYTDAE